MMSYLQHRCPDSDLKLAPCCEADMKWSLKAQDRVRRSKVTVSAKNVLTGNGLTGVRLGQSGIL